MGLHIDNISKYEMRRIVAWVKNNYPEADITAVLEDGNLICL